MSLRSVGDTAVYISILEKEHVLIRVVKFGIELITCLS